MDIATHAPGGLQAPIPGDNSFIAALRAKCPDTGRHPSAQRKCYYCDEEGHIKERCPLRLKDFLQQRSDQQNCKTTQPQASTAGRANRTASPGRKKHVKFAEIQQMLPIVAESYGRKCVASLKDDGDQIVQTFLMGLI